MESPSILAPGFSFTNRAGQEINLLCQENLTPVISFNKFVSAAETSTTRSLASSSETSPENQHIHSQEEPHGSQSSLPSPPAHLSADRLRNGQAFLRQKFKEWTTQTQSNNEPSREQSGAVDNAIAIHGTPDPTLPDSQCFPGFKEATHETHRIDSARGLVNKRTGKAHMYTVLRTSDELVVMSLQPWKDHDLCVQFVREHDWSVPTRVIYINHRYFAWDTQGNILRTPRDIPSFCAPENPKDDPSCALCADESHRLEDCLGPPDRFSGAIHGCPACNTLEHLFGDCSEVKGTTGKEPMSLERRFELLVVKRQDKPMFFSDRSFTPEDYDRLLPEYPIRGMPWSTRFAREQFDKGGPWLRYDYHAATPELPRDPWGERLLQALRSGLPPETCSEYFET